MQVLSCSDRFRFGGVFGALRVDWSDPYVQSRAPCLLLTANVVDIATRR